MQRILLSSVVVASFVAAFAIVTLAGPPGAAKPPAGAPAGIKWHTSLQTAHKQAVAENKPLLIVFGAEWCGFCKKLEKQTLNTPELSKYINDTFVAVHLDLDKEKKIGEILEVHALPCTIVLSPNADLLGRINGYETAAPFQKKLVAARELYHPQPVQTAAAPGPVVR
ncbi:thioredoxin family protein [Planctomicrobium piriforme]|uniref:Thioredoxin-like n=1 Tax=Planctomicrobium piriforme TaxID=1576369 RepID=A0A1I3G0G4_9PLAN|nr:thioredoxin family protein [Planctomicrobium piriforme]SFI16949.1 Thioredoxin-like [Planctomicrobium piriforme]